MDQFNPPESTTMQTGNGRVQYNQNQQPNQNINNFQNQQQNQGVPDEIGQNFQPPIQNQQPNNYQQQNQNNYQQPNNYQPPVQNYQQQPNQNNYNQNNNFNQQPNQSYQQPNNNFNQPRYRIVDLYWLMNPKCEDSEPKFEPGEAQFISISYNITFGNLKVTLFNIPQGAIQGHVLFYNTLQKLTTGTVYNGSCGKLFYSSGDIEFTCLEQLFTNTGQDWQTQRQMCSFIRKDNETVLTIKDPNSGTFWYHFKDWQQKLLMDSCKFCINEGTLLSGQLKLKG